MRITHRIEHPGSLARVYAMLNDPEYQRQRAERSGSLEHNFVLDETPEAHIGISRRRMSTQDFPDAFRGFVGKTIDLVETIRWGLKERDDFREGAYTFEVEGTPVTMVGGVHLTQIENGTAHVLDGELKAHLPLFSSRIEKAIQPLIEDGVELEDALGREWLAAHPE